MMRNLFLLALTVLLSLNLTSQNTNLSNGVVFDGEPFLAINPSNSQHIVVAWMGYKFNNLIVIKTRVSMDAGQTWSSTADIPHTVAGYQSADPSLGFDMNGNVFLCFIDYTPSPAAGAVYVSKSTDGGLSWGTPVEVINVNDDGNQLPVDRPWMVIDNSGGVNDGNIYVTTMNPNAFGPVTPPYNPYFIRSTDGGTSFEPWRYMDTTGWLAGSFIPQPMPTPAISANGTFHAVYPSYVVSQSLFAQYILASSNSAGSSFSYVSILQSATTVNDTSAKKGYLLRSNPADSNHLAFIYPNFDNGDMDIYAIESVNAGANWSTPERVNDDPIANNRMQDLLWADFDVDGDLIVAWRDRRNGTDSTYQTSTEIYAAVKWKDSTNFSANFTLSDSSVSYNSVLENSGNDFMCINMINDTAYAVWGDTRNGFLNIWFQRMDLTTGASSVQDLANDVSAFSAYPNPVIDQLNLDFSANDLTNAKFEIINTTGQIVSSMKITTSKASVNMTQFAPGNYFIRFTNAKGSRVLKVVNTTK